MLLLTADRCWPEDGIPMLYSKESSSHLGNKLMNLFFKMDSSLYVCIFAIVHMS